MQLSSQSSNDTAAFISTIASSPVLQVTRSTFKFEVPSRWRPSIMNGIKEKRLTSEVRNEISRDLVTLLYTYEADPNAAHCKKVAALLVAKYPFMADGPDTGANKAVRLYICIYIYMCIYIFIYRVHGN